MWRHFGAMLNKLSIHWNENVVILMKFSSLVILTTFSAASDENFIKMKTFPFQSTYFKRKVLTKYGQLSAAGFVFSGDMVLAPTCTGRHVLMHLPHKTLLFKHFKIARFAPTKTDVSWRKLSSAIKCIFSEIRCSVSKPSEGLCCTTSLYVNYKLIPDIVNKHMLYGNCVWIFFNIMTMTCKYSLHCWP